VAGWHDSCHIMGAMTDPPSKPLTFDEVRAMLPSLEELRPVTDRLLAESTPDPARAWSGAGALDTAGSRLVDLSGLAAEISELAAAEARHVEVVYRHVAEALGLASRGDATGAARALLDAAAVEEERGRPDRAGSFADAAYRVALDGGEPVVRGRALRRRARARRAAARYEEAKRDYAEAWGVSDAVSDARGAAEAAIGAGNVLEDEGRWADAEAWYRKALTTLGEHRLVPERWHALLNLHVVLRSGGAVEESRTLLDEAEAVALEMGDGSARVFIDNARGQWHMAQDAFDEAQTHLRNALEAAVAPRARVTVRLNLAEALLAQGRRLDAAEEARRAESEAITGRVIDRLPETYRLLGRIAALEGNPDAFVLFERSLEMIEETRLPAVERARTLQAYAEAEGLVGDSEKAAALTAEAERTYRELGIRHPRSAWADRHGPDRKRASDHD
jgi:tetratricopeptide (TPR) repeat protein